MVRLVLALATLSACALAGCAAVACSMEKDGERTQACEADYAADARAREQAEQDADAARAVRGNANAQREVDGARCNEGDAHACLSVATFDEAHGGKPAGAYDVACRARLSFGCYGAGRFASDPAIALADQDRGCQLGEKLACEEAARLAPDRAVAFHEAACALRDYHACSSAAFGYIYGAGVARDVGKGKAIAEHACTLGDKDSCALVDEAAAETR